MTQRDLQTEFFRPADAKQVIGVSRTTIYDSAKNKKITIYKHAGMSFVSMAEVRKLLGAVGDH